MRNLITFGLAVLAAAGTGRGADEEPAITPLEIATFRERLAPVVEHLEEKLADFEKALADADDALAVERVRQATRPGQVSSLRYLLFLEDDLRLLATPKDEVDEGIEPDDFSSQERRKLATLRQEIRDAERERIREELKTGQGFYHDARTAKDIYRDEMSLDSLYDRNVSKLERDINPLSPPCIPPKFVLHGLSSKSKFLAVSVGGFEGRGRSVSLVGEEGDR